jgi:hypothetical protein
MKPVPRDSCRSRRCKQGFFLIIVTLILYPHVSLALSKAESERISCFVLGKVHASLCPITGYLEEDPLFTYSLEPIPSGLTDEERRKYDRLYYPRTREILLETYDMLFFSDARIQHFTPRQYHDLDFSFREAGLPSVWSFGPAYGQAIESSILHEVLPVSDHNGHFHKNWRVVFRPQQDHVFDPFVELGMERVIGDGYAYVVPRPGSIVWGDMQPLDTPFLVSWRPGGSQGGLTWVFADEYNQLWWGLSSTARGNNPYAIDMATNLILHSLDRPLIRDIHSRREGRRLISTFKAQKLLVLSLMEWADNFGANVLDLSERLSILEYRVDDAFHRYLDQDYHSTITIMQSTETTIIDITGDAIRLKNEALLWVYISEWMVVTSVAMLTGFVVWTLMVRRRLYRRVETTRMRIQI